MNERICKLKKKMLEEKRFASIEQAIIVTKAYEKNEAEPIPVKRAMALKAALCNMEIAVTEGELVVGNRTKGVRYGVVFPESGSSWIDKEFESLPIRPQDRFNVHEKDIGIFRKVIAPYWKGKSLEDVIRKRYGKEIAAIEKVVKINQKDHAQGHICPDCRLWLTKGPAGLRKDAEEAALKASGDKKDFYRSVAIVMEGVQIFIKRYSALLRKMAKKVRLRDMMVICMYLQIFVKKLQCSHRIRFMKQYSHYGFYLLYCRWSQMHRLFHRDA